MEIRKPIQKYKVYKLCENCRKHLVHNTHEIKWINSQPLHEHRCSKCGYLGYYKEIYPYIKEVEE